MPWFLELVSIELGFELRPSSPCSQTLGYTALQMGNNYHYLRTWARRSPLCSHNQSQGYGVWNRRPPWRRRSWGGPRSHQIVQLRVGGEERPLGADLGERERPGRAHPVSCPPHFTVSPGAQRMVGAHLLGKGCDVLIEGIGGAYVTAWGCAQPSPSPITGRTRGQFTFLKDQGQQREERVSGESRG